MEPTVYSLSDVRGLHNPVFVDANILIYLFWPTGEKWYETSYAKAYSQLLKNENQLYINFSVISEVINRIIRIEHKKYNEDQTFKRYRNSADGEEVLEDIYAIFDEVILPRFEIVDKGFNKEEIEDFLVYDELDFNDKAIARICQEQDLLLLTNDGDFKKTGIEIITGNRVYFKQ